MHDWNRWSLCDDKLSVCVTSVGDDAAHSRRHVHHAGRQQQVRVRRERRIDDLVAIARRRLIYLHPCTHITLQRSTLTLSLPSLQSRQMGSNPCNCMDYGVETIKRQTMAAYGCFVAGQSPWARAWTAQPIGCTPAVSVTQKRRCSCSCGLWRYISVVCLCLTTPTTLHSYIVHTQN